MRGGLLQLWADGCPCGLRGLLLCWALGCGRSECGGREWNHRSRNRFSRSHRKNGAHK